MSGVDPVAAARLRIEAKIWSHRTRGSRVTYKGADEELLAAGVLTPDLLKLLGDRKVRQITQGNYGNTYTLRRLKQGTTALEVIVYDTCDDAHVHSRHHRRPWRAAGEAVAAWLRSKGLRPGIEED